MSKSELSNLSYTNKDFNSIYTELLDYAKKLSYKWDPSASDESDPGVVLLKLAALIGDKDSYNIDKNVLELMPSSVTQLPAARQLFDQCGYSMRYYRAAEGTVNLILKKDLGDTVDSKITYTYTIPMFTMFSDSDSTTVYTTTQPCTTVAKEEVTVPVMEGTVTRYTINNDSLITFQNLDANNRLYFTETNIAENGIFITNSGKSNYSDWQRVDNLQTQPKGKFCYKFGLSIDNSVCYIEFPEDIELLIGEGLNISYLLTSGSDGNISAGRLKQFYVDTKFLRKEPFDTTGVDVSVTAEDVSIRNSLPILNGKDPESIDDAYKNYKRVRDTFQTLVSLKDYTDYLVTSETASNGYVCDRTNDIQRAYKVLTTEENSTYLKSMVKQKTYYRADSLDQTELEMVEEPTMDAFDLCVYALEYVPSVTNATLFKNSFKLKDLSKKYLLNGSVFKNDDSFDVKSIQHNFVGFESNTILMIKNKYPINVNIVPRFPLSLTEKYQVIQNIETSLYEALNSNKMVFGDVVSIDVIQETVLNADDRIKTIIDFMSPKYETYAIYIDENNEFHELRIDNESWDGGYVEIVLNAKQYNDKIGNTSFWIRDTIENKFKEVNKSDTFDSSLKYYVFDNNLSKLWSDFRAEIFSKNVLAGVTPLYDDDNKYTFSIEQEDLKEYTNISKISTNTSITLKNSSNNGDTGGEDSGDGEGTDSPSLDTKLESNQLSTNESILLTCPNLVQENNFSSYVKVLYYLPECNSDISSESRYELTGDDFIIFFWKASDASSDYTYIKYDSSSNSLANYISPSNFNLKKLQDLSSTKPESKHLNEDAIFSHFKNKVAGKKLTTNGSSIINNTFDASSGLNDISETEFVNSYLKSETNNQVLTGTRIINTLRKNEIHINNKIDGCQYVYWILNTAYSDRYVLFESDETEYTLKTGEYFIYTNDDASVLHILGQGTKIKRSKKWLDSEWAVDSISYEELITEGIDILVDKWFAVPRVNKSSYDDNILGIWAIEQQQILIGPYNRLVLEPKNKSDAASEISITSDTDTSLNGYKISYVDNENNVTNVPDVDSDSIYWSATSILNLNSSNDNPQVLTNNQTLKIEYDTGEPDEISGTVGADGTYTPVYIQSSESLNLLGGSYNTTELLIDDPSAFGLLTYKTAESNSTYSPSDPIVIDVKEGTEITKDYSFKLLSGKYILQITAPDDTIVNVTMTPEYVLKPLNGKNAFKLIIENEETVTLTLTCSASKNSTISIQPLFRFKTITLDNIPISQDDDSSFEAKVLYSLNELDVEDKLNYTHIPNNAIKNPLISTEFLKNNHVYNKYTICEWDNNSSDNIKVHDVVR